MDALKSLSDKHKLLIAALIIATIIAAALSETVASIVGAIVAIPLMIAIPLLLIALYMLPSIIANKRKHRNITPIILVNFFLGWTWIGWFVALVWSTTKDVHDPQANQPPAWGSYPATTTPPPPTQAPPPPPPSTP